MDKYEELASEYRGLSEYIKSVIGEEPEKFSDYIAASALRIWAGNVLYSPDYQRALRAVTGSNYSVEEIVTAMNCCGEEGRYILIPGFYKKIVEKSRSERGITEKFIKKLSSLLEAMAFINGDFTIEEANTLSELTDQLISYTRSNSVYVSGNILGPKDITEKSETGYLRNGELLHTAKENCAEKTAGDEEPNDEKDEEITPVLKVSITGEDDKLRDFLSETLDLDPASIFIRDVPDKKECRKEKEPQQEKKSDETLESLLAELDDLVGLDDVKRDVHSLINFIGISQIRKKRGMKVPAVSYHLVFTGNPGTGKTTVARLIAKLYYHMGLLPKGQLVEAERSTLVAGYMGQTAIKTQEVIQQALGGVLFIDEAYSLAGDKEDSFGKEAIDTILKAMEDHRDELVVIVAGYTELMHKFIDSNPGLSSRFSKYFEFADYTGEQMSAIFDKFCENGGYSAKPEAMAMLKKRFGELYEERNESFGNARAVRNIFEKAIGAQANRLSGAGELSDRDLEILTEEDVISAVGGRI